MQGTAEHRLQQIDDKFTVTTRTYFAQKFTIDLLRKLEVVWIVLSYKQESSSQSSGVLCCFQVSEAIVIKSIVHIHKSSNNIKL